MRWYKNTLDTVNKAGRKSEKAYQLAKASAELKRDLETILCANQGRSAGTGYWTPSASITYTNVTLSTAFDAVLIYNSSASDKAVSVHTFGSQTVTAGTFTLTMPSNTTSTALLRLATT